MAGEQEQKSRDFWISNMTRNTSLEFHGFDSQGHSPPRLRPNLPALLSDGCRLFREPEPPQSERLVVYEANSFTLAIFVHVCRKFPTMLQLELSLDKAHLGQEGELGGTFSRMSRMLNPLDTDRTAVTRCNLHGRGTVSVWLIAGPYKVTATLSRSPKIFLEVRLEEQEIN